jgi:hypothetical protein
LENRCGIFVAAQSEERAARTHQGSDLSGHEAEFSKRNRGDAEGLVRRTMVSVRCSYEPFSELPTRPL